MLDHEHVESLLGSGGTPCIPKPRTLTFSANDCSTAATALDSVPETSLPGPPWPPRTADWFWPGTESESTYRWH